MRILTVTPYYKPAWRFGGPPRCIAEWSEYLVRQTGMRIDVVTLNRNGDAPLYAGDGVVVRTVEGVTVHYLPMAPGRAGKAYFGSPALQAVLARFTDVDLVHVNTLFNAFSRKGMQYAARHRIPFLVTPHGMLDRYSLSRSGMAKRMHRMLFDDRLLRRAAAVHFTTENERHNAVLHGPVRSVVLPLGMAFPAGPLPARQQPQDGTRLVFLGRINRKKGIDRLVAALASLPAGIRTGITLDIFGNDDEQVIPELEALVARNALGGTVRFRGALDPAERDATLARYDSLVLTSHQENFGMVVAEALATGLPVFVSDKVNLCDFVSKHRCGWISDLSVDGIAAALLRIHDTSPDERRRMGAAGALAVRESFSLEKIGPRYAELYRQLAGQGKPGP